MGRYTPLSDSSSWSDAYAVPAVILSEELLKQKLLIPCRLLKFCKNDSERNISAYESLR